MNREQHTLVRRLRDKTACDESIVVATTKRSIHGKVRIVHFENITEHSEYRESARQRREELGCNQITTVLLGANIITPSSRWSASHSSPDRVSKMGMSRR